MSDWVSWVCFFCGEKRFTHTKAKWAAHRRLVSEGRRNYQFKNGALEEVAHDRPHRA